MGDSVSLLGSPFPHLGSVGFHDLVSITFTTVDEGKILFLQLGLKKKQNMNMSIFFCSAECSGRSNMFPKVLFLKQKTSAGTLGSHNFSF